MLSGDEVYDDEVTSGPIPEPRPRCRVCGHALVEGDCDSCAFDRWAEQREDDDAAR